MLTLSLGNKWQGFSMRLAWGRKVNEAFARKVVVISKDIGSEPDNLMGCMAFENIEKFKSNVKNPTGGATGLIQFMPATAKSLGTTTAKLAAMTEVDQLDYVAKYFKPYRGKLKTIDDLYMAILWPKAVGKPPSYVLFDRNSPATVKAYFQNKGLDLNKNGQVTKQEAAAGPRAKLAKGLLPQYAADFDIDDELPTEDPQEAADDVSSQSVESNGPDADTEWIETALKGMNYYTGRIDGFPGGKLFGAITGFLTDWDERDADITPPKTNDDYEEIKDQLRNELTYAQAEKFVRPVTQERAEAKPEIVNEVAPEAKGQKRGIIATAWAGIVMFFSSIFTAVSDSVMNAFNWITGHKDSLPDGVTDPGWLSSGAKLLKAIPPSMWFMLAAGVFGLVAFGLIGVLKKTVNDVRTGVR